MSQHNVELVRQIYEGWGRGDFRAGTELYDPYVLLVLRAFPDAGAYCGPEEIQKYMREDFLVPTYQVWSFRGPSVIRIESIRGREEALEAADLSE